MAQKEIVFGELGGGSETVLWTNPSSSSNFAAQNITLSQSISSYRLIGILIKDLPATSDTSSKNMTCYISPADLRNSIVQNGNNQFSFGSRSSVTWLRACWYVDDTTLNISVAYKTNAAGTSEAVAIPVKVVGIS